MTSFDNWHFAMARGNGMDDSDAGQTALSPLAKYDLTIASDGKGYFEPAFRRASPTFGGPPLLLLVVTSALCSFAKAANAQARSTFPAAATLTPHVKVQDTPRVVGSTENPAYPLKASANNRYLVDQNDVPFLMVGDSPQALIGKL